MFRLIYGGSAYSYANDPNFSVVSKSEKFWQGVIDETYSKYRGLAEWHKQLVQQVAKQGYIRTPFGREYHYKPERKRGELVWPRTTILNYPVQGWGADLMQIARVSAWRRLKDKATFIATVHDDIELDVPNDPELLYQVCTELEKVFQDVPANVKRIYGYEMRVPLSGEVSFGNNLKQMKEFVNNGDLSQFDLTELDQQ